MPPSMWLVTLLPLLALGASTPPAASNRLVVLELRGEGGVKPDLLSMLTEELVVRVHQQAPDRAVLGPSDLQALLGLAAKRAKFGDASSKSLGKVGGALGASEMVTGTVGRLGTTYLVTLSLFEVETASVLREKGKSLAKPKTAALLGAIDELTGELLPSPPNPSEGDASASGTDPQTPPPPSESVEERWGEAPPPTAPPPAANAWGNSWGSAPPGPPPAYPSQPRPHQVGYQQGYRRGYGPTAYGPPPPTYGWQRPYYRPTVFAPLNQAEALLGIVPFMGEAHFGAVRRFHRPYIPPPVYGGYFPHPGL